MPPSNTRTGGGTSLDATVSIGPSLYSVTSKGMLVQLADLGHPMRDDKSMCKCYGHKPRKSGDGAG